MVGNTLGHYEILEPLGKGGMGIVYRARDTKLDREIAVKVLPDDFATDRDRLRRFEREAKTVAALDHPNIVTVHSVEEVDNVHFITMQLVDGKTLSELIPRRGFDLDRFFTISIAIAEAIGSAHQQAITHRDLKPANIMVSEDGRVRVLDFGLAKSSTESANTGSPDATPTQAATDDNVVPASDLTEEGVVLGTVAYMAPEQAEGKSVDPRSDVFSLGVMLYEMATGRRPFEGDTRISLLSSIVKEDPVSPTELNRRLPRHLGRIIRKCLQKDPDRRYQTARGLRNDLEGLKEEVDSGAVSLGSSEPDDGLAKRSPWASLARAAVVVLTIAALTWMASDFFRPAEQPDFAIESTARVSNDPGTEIHPAISPDGNMIAYAAGTAGSMRLYLRQVSGGRPIPLTEDFPGDHRWPRWSPDGSELSFESEHRVYVMPAFGGAPRELVRKDQYQASTAAAGGAWSPTGDRIAIPLLDEIAIHPVHRDTTTALTVAAAPYDPNSLAWSPDGAWIAFVSGNIEFTFGDRILANIAPSAIWLMPAEGGDPVPVIDDGTLNVSPVWLPDSRALLFVSDKDGSRDVYLQRINADGTPSGPPERLTTGLDAHTLSMSADGTMLSYAELSHEANIWSIPIPPDGTTLSGSEAEAVTTGGQAIEGISVSPDGQWLAFDSDRSGNQEVYKMRLPAGESVQLTTDPSADFIPSWSPDGEEIAFYSMRDGSRDLFVMSASGTTVRQVTSDPAQESYPDWSPDGNQLVFRSDFTDREEIWVVSRASRDAEWGNARQLTFDGGVHPRWSPDGRYISFANANQLWMVPAEGGDPIRLVGPSFGLSSLPFADWSSDSQTIYFKGAANENRSSGFWSIPVTGGEPTPLVVLDNPSLPSLRYEFATNGARFFFTLADQQSDVFVMNIRR